MKLAVEGWQTIHTLGEEKGIALLKESGFDAVDYSFYWTDPSDNILGDDYLERASKTKELLDKYDLVCNQTHAPFGNAFGAPIDLSNPLYADIVRALEYSSIIGAKHMVVHGVKVPKGISELEVNKKYYESFLPYIKQFGTKIAVENLASTLTTPERMNALMEQLDPECFVALVDVGHANHRNIAPESFIRRVLPGRLQGLHIHDNYGQIDDHILPYMGTIQWKYVLEALAEVDYSGDFTMELLGFLPKYGKDMLPEALAFAAGVGRKLMTRLQSIKG